MAEDDRGGSGIEFFANEGAGNVVGKMAHAAHNALLYRPRVRTDFQHVQIVIRFEQQNIGTSQVHANGTRQIAEVGDDRNFDSFGAEPKADRVDRVVRNGEARHFDIADGEGVAGGEDFDRRDALAPGDRGCGEAREKRRDAAIALVQFVGDRAETGDVIAVLVRDQNGVDR